MLFCEEEYKQPPTRISVFQYKAVCSLVEAKIAADVNCTEY